MKWLSKHRSQVVLVLFAIIIVSLIGTLLSLNSHIDNRNDVIDRISRTNMVSYGKLAAELIPLSEIESVKTNADTKTAAYKEIESELAAFTKENNLTYIYFMRAVEKDGQKYVQYLWDTDGSDKHCSPDSYLSPNCQSLLNESSNVYKAFNGEDVITDLGAYEKGWEGLRSVFHPVRNGDGEIMGVIGVDISDARIIETRKSVQSTVDFSLVEVVLMIIISVIIIALFRKEIKTANAANAAKTEFLSKMSHELRTPLSAVIGMLDMANKSNDVTKIKGYYMVKMRIAANNLLQNINDILDISKIETGKMTLMSYQFDIEEVFRSTFDIMEVAAHEKHININLNIQPNMKKFFNGDGKRLSQIYMNLLSNAVKFTPENGSITVGVKYKELADGRVEVTSTVADTGVGIPKNKIGKLFQNFSQIDNSLSRQYTGSGLGLVIVKNMVELMGGKIGVDSQENVGTTFTFNVLLEPSDNQEELEISTNLFNVLIIDDQQETLDYLSQLLDARKIRHQVADSGAEGLKLIKGAEKSGEAFNVILVDYLMPKMNGIETIKKIKKHVRDDTLIMMISSADYSTVEAEVKEIGIEKFLQKPVLPSDLINSMNEMLSKKLVKNSKAKKESYDFSGKTILLVEDNETNREIVQFSLEDTGVKIVEAADGKIGVRLYKENPKKFDLILMDVQMPHLDGLEATKLIRSSGKPTAKTVPIIAMTANVFVDQIEEALSAGMNKHLGKPINAREMKEMLAKYINHKES